MDTETEPKILKIYGRSEALHQEEEETLIAYKN